jgi:hypothetical protein
MPGHERLSGGGRARVDVGHSTYHGSAWTSMEFACTKPFLKSGVFHLQQIQPVSLNRLETKLGALTSDEFRSLGKKLAAVLKLGL